MNPHSTAIITSSDGPTKPKDCASNERTLLRADGQQLFKALFLSSIIVAVCATAGLPFHGPLLFTSVGFWALSITLLPTLHSRDYNIFSPWTFVILTVLIGMALRGLCISFGFPSPERIDLLFILGRPVESFYYPSIVTLTGLAMLTVGYSLAPSSGGANFPSEHWRPNRLAVIAVLMLGCSLTATFIYVKNTGGFTADLLSAKRTTISGLDLRSNEDYRGYGLLRKLGRGALFAHLALVAYTRDSDNRKSANRLRLLSACLIVAACLIPFYASSRADVVMAIACSLAVSTILGRTVRYRRILAVCAVLLVGLSLMTLLRQRAEVNPLASIGKVAEHVVVNRNQLGLAKTSHIINAIPETLEPQWGRTILVWLAAPVPRSIWTNKPLVHSGPIIGRKIYGNFVSGVPPGIVAELYWNFYWPGVIIGMFLFGTFMRWISDRLANRYRQNSVGVLLYVVGPMSMAPFIMGGSIGSGLFNMIVDMLMMKCILLFAIER